MNGEITGLGILEIQIRSRILMICDIYVISSLNQDDLGKIGLKYSKTVENALEEIISTKKLSKSDVKILVLPAGPQILPKLKP